MISQTHVPGISQQRKKLLISWNSAVVISRLLYNDVEEELQGRRRSMCSRRSIGLLLLLTLVGSHGGPVEDAFNWLATHREAAKQELLELASIPSVSSNPAMSDSCLAAAKWLAKRAKRAGLENVEVLPTEAKTHQPVVYGDWLHAPGKPTLLIYGHYDVQPAEDVELWDSPPFKASFKDGYFYGRGVDDDKGGVVPALQALEAYLKTSSQLPLNIKIFLEGQEEIGSPNMPAFLEKHKELLKADYAISADGGQDSPTQGILALGLRGASAFEVQVKTLDKDVHSGTFGGSVQNANHALAQFVANLHQQNGSVAIPGFYDKVREITDEDRDDIAAFKSFSLEDHLARASATEAVGEDGFNTLERVWHRPTCEVVGQFGGFTGPGLKTIVPGKATAKLACRLVPDQDPQEIIELARKYVESIRIPGASLKFIPLSWAAPPYAMDKDTPVNRAVSKVLEHMLGAPPAYYRVGGSIPAAAFMKTYLGIDFTMFGFGLPQNNIHSPNERYGLEEFLRAQEGYVRVLAELGGLDSSITSLQSANEKDEL